MKIWIDADACPGAIKELLFRASGKRGIALALVANKYMRAPRSDLIEVVQVADGADVADDYIVEQMQAGDLVISNDVPLAARVVEKQGKVITPSGYELNEGTIGERLSTRNFMDDLRGAGVDTGGPKAFSSQDKQRFANALDRFLTANKN